jgi:N-acetylglucosamine-6-phosphate deacetylase
LGLHVEGPWLNCKFLGAHPSRGDEAHDISLWEAFISALPVRMVTLSPEVKNPFPLIQKLSKRGVLVAAGHTAADSATLKKAKGAGLSLVTHLFNAMSPLHHRVSNPISAVLGLKMFPYTLIADGVHVSQENIMLCLNAYSQGLILVSDMNGAAFSETHDPHVEKREGKCFVKEKEVLAGSLSSLWEDIIFVVQECGMSLPAAVRAATEAPAKLLGLTKKGSLQLGCDADFFIFDRETFTIARTYVGGAVAWG